MDGEVAVAELPRLADVLSDRNGAVSYRIDGTLGAERKPMLHVAAHGKLNLRCQRCLEALTWNMAVDSRLQLIRAGQAIPDEELENDESDALEIGGEIDVLALIEDEILLAMPLAPRHERCGLPNPGGDTDKKSPFAVLAALRGNTGGKA